MAQVRVMTRFRFGLGPGHCCGVRRKVPGRRWFVNLEAEGWTLTSPRSCSVRKGWGGRCRAEEGTGVWWPGLTPKRGSPVMGKWKSHGQGETWSQKSLWHR